MNETTDLLTVEDFISLLHQLDSFIEAKLPTTALTIRAIGGFSLMYHEQEASFGLLRMSSADIDTLTKLPKNIATMVDIIATNNGVNSDWLNDRWYANNDFKEELEPYITWEPSTHSFKHIDLQVASLEGVLLMKIRALCDALEFTGYPANQEKLDRDLRTQDLLDVVALFGFFNIRSASDLEALPLPIDILGFDRFIQYAVDQGIVTE